VFLPEDALIWFNVQVETLKRVHSSWVPDVPIELLTQARKLPLGRRWLARRLSVVSPVLFGLPTDLDSQALEKLKAAAWIAPLVAEPMECALELGSLAMAPTLRTFVNRPEVVKIRGALGADRYARILASPVAMPAPQPSPVSETGELVERLIRCGAAEFAGLADSLHPAWGESVRLTYDRSWWSDARSPSLSAAAAESCLRVGVLH
jgi:hypothetical protein